MKHIKLIKAAVLASAVFLAACAASGNTYRASCGYERIEQAESPEVVRITESMSERYPICPEVLQALIFYESSNRSFVVSRWGDVGYMQVNPGWQQERMDRLGVSDLTDGYGNILVGTDYLMELCRKYGDISIALTAYNKGEEAADGTISPWEDEYSRKILELSEKLERMHFK